MRTIAIMGGSDWTDAGVCHISVPDDMDIEEQRDEYTRQCYANRRFAMSFSDWLLQNGAVTADVEEVWE